MAINLSKGAMEVQSDSMEMVQTMHEGGFSAIAAVAIYDETG